ncbi:LysR family transcriptional regulator [Bosea sp. (in: a-proteobacteria)]|uniref:LysR family transcriptional regulator n=1 Tax=Bosea sp. (in: a-proteobacteria) TaxID=1871050 RepID=UPI002618FA8A|nr:LysR family transcriptional regulator [Bosea sp. (in: a-proteobacteria)]MCO5091699.1 LysR family transcriptional regulator [Bosea sp. (in: a-proteobacteria)]
MDVTIRQLKAFLEIANVRNFRIASTNLGMSQPSLSALLKDLERKLGTALFTRTTRHVSLTNEGAHFVPIAEGLVRNFDLVIKNAWRDIKDRGNRVSIAISVTSIIPLIFPKLLKELSQTHPDIKLRLVSGLTRDMLERVTLGDAHLGIISAMPTPKLFTSRKLLSDRLVVIGRRDDPVMQDGSPMDWELLRRQSFVAWNSGGGMRNVIDMTPQLAELMERSHYEASNWEALKGMVAVGLGLTVVPWIIAHQERGGNLIYREIAELPGGAVSGREVFMAERRDAPRSAVTQIVVDLIDRHIKESTAYAEKT